MGETTIGLCRLDHRYRCWLILVRSTRLFDLGLYLRYTAAHGFSHISTQKGNDMKSGSMRILSCIIVATLTACLLEVAFARGQAGQAERSQMAEDIFTNVQ